MLRGLTFLSSHSIPSRLPFLFSSRPFPFSFTSTSFFRCLNTSAYDGILIGCYQGETPSLDQFGKTGFSVNDATNNSIFNQMESSNFLGKLGDHRTFFPINCEHVPPRVTVVGLGKRPQGKLPWEHARKATAVGVKALKQVGATRIGIERFGQVSEHVIAESATLALHSFTHLKQRKEPGATRLTPPTFHILDPVSPLIPSSSKPILDSFTSGLIYGESQNLARTWMESPSNVLTPSLFAESILDQFVRLPQVLIHVHDETWALQHRMQLFHAVAKGSKEPLKFIEMKYQPVQNDIVHVALVGKGVTFDSGGISLKPSANMGLMKGDMGGAAVMASVMYGIAKLGLPINVVALLPLCENMPSGSAFKPGDAVRAANGLTIEIDNTDAEGRLLLADALHYATTFQPKCILDAATLTGAIDVALGSLYSGVFTNSSHLWNELQNSAQSTGDAIWRMPLNDAYLEDLRSEIADLSNCGKRSAGACTAAIFLKQFLTLPDVTCTIPFAHMDIAGTMHYTKDVGYLSEGMTGRPTRLLIDFFAKMSQNEASLKGLEKGWELDSH